MYLSGTIGERIGDLRKELSQKELSKIIGIAPSQLSRIEKGQTQHISSDILIKLAQTFHVSTDYILGLTTVSTPKSYDISEIGLSEGAVKALVSDSVDVQILNRIIDHKRFPYLMLLIKKYFDDENVAGIMGRNEVIDFATTTLADFAKENPEHKADVRDDIRYLKSEKLGEHEADLEKIKSTFIAIIKDIKSECAENKEPAPIATADFMRGIWEQLQDKPRAEVTEEDVSAAVMNMVGKTAKLDSKTAVLFQKIITRVLKNSRNKLINSNATKLKMPYGCGFCYECNTILIVIIRSFYIFPCLLIVKRNYFVDSIVCHIRKQGA